MRQLSDERGAILPITAVMLAALLGFSVLVVDVGDLYWERRQLQNGADGAAYAIAMDCANGSCGAYDTKADTLADGNAIDGAATIDSVTFPGGMSPAAGSVKVDTSTDSGGSNLLPPVFARILDPSYNGKTVTASATVAWGGPSSLTSQLPITISECEFNAFTAGGTTYEPPPPYPPYPTERIILFHTTDGSTCPSSNSGADLPGGFGWLNTTEDCVATSTADGWFADSTGAPPPNSCSNAELSAMIGQIVHIPIYKDVNGLSGSNGEYLIDGYASFFLTGYKFPSARERSIVTNTFPCSGSDHCISGFFVDDPGPVSGVVGGPSMGVTVFNMTE